MAEDEVRAMALAIAKANKHSDPEGWADDVVEAFTTGTVAREPAPEDPEGPPE